MRRTFIVLALLVVAIVGCDQNVNTTSDRLDRLFDRLHDHQLFRGTTVVSDRGDVVYATSRGLASEEWQIPNAVETRFRIASLSKQFTAVLVLQLADKGLIGLDDSLATVLDGLPEAWAKPVTVRNLLNQTSGIPDYTLLPDYLETVSKRRFTRDGFLQLIRTDPLFSSLNFTPGAEWEYSNTNYFLLGVLAETVAEMPFEDLLKRRIFAPLEMNDSGVFDSLRPIPELAQGYEITFTGEVERAAHSEFSPKSVPSGGLYSTAPDLLRWSAALHEDRLLSATAQQVFTTPTHQVDEATAYVCGQWREFRETPADERVEIFSHGGSIMGMSTWLLREPAGQRCVVLLNNGGGARETMLEQVALAILEILDGGPGGLPPLDLIGPLGSTYFNHREHLIDHYQLLKEHHAEMYDFSAGQLSMLGTVLLDRLGDRETAALLFRLNLEENPESSLTHRDLGALLLEEGDTDTALAHLTRARELSAEPDPDLDALIARAR